MLKALLKSRSPIAKKMVLLIVGASTVFALVSVVVQLAFHFTGAVRHIEQSVDEYNQANITALEQALWYIDYNLVDDLLQALLKQQYVGMLKLEVNDELNIAIGVAELSEKIYVYPLVYQQQNLGQLSVGLDLSVVKRDIVNQALVIFLTNGFKTLLMTLIILLLVTRLVTHDLHRLAKVADQIFTKQQQIVQLPDQLLQRNDEIGLVASSMQQLQHRFQRGLDARLAAELQLHQHREELEATVEQRTALLNWQTEANKLLSEISLSFLTQGSTDELLQRALAIIGRLFAVERVCVFTFEGPLAVYRNVWTLFEQEVRLDPIDLEPLRLLNAYLRDATPFTVNDIETVKQQAEPEYELLRERGIKSFAGFPLHDGKQTFGLLSCASLNYRSIWHDHQVTLLSQFATAITSLLVKEKKELALVRLQSELLQANQRLLVLAETDELTGLLNRRPFKRELTRAIASARRHKSKLAVMMADIDYFKAYNDRYGHLQGDEALKLVAKALTSVVQRSEDCVARVGGEEFALLLTDVNQDELPLMARRIVEQVAALQVEHQDSQVSPVLTISLGGVLLNSMSVDDNNEILQMADNCLYDAKHQGRNRAVLDLVSD
ncbi:diguanylate cyclase domain-containing protein [Agarivorans sp. QJM3NY_33]|uniref:GGDEF domain-containing protein n=1 Tax=Agarivorans sp. QJM3NY_33 TaxID=3421432 RepID=UPI003D7C603A